MTRVVNEPLSSLLRERTLLTEEIGRIQKRIEEIDRTLEIASRHDSLASVEQQHQHVHDFGHGLSRWQISRYSRQILLPEVGVTGGGLILSCVAVIDSLVK